MKSLLFLAGVDVAALLIWAGLLEVAPAGNAEQGTQNTPRILIGQLASDGRCEAGVTGDGQGVTPIPGGGAE